MPAHAASEHGTSKLTLKQNALYLMHLAHLYAFAMPLGLALALAGALALACLAAGAASGLLR